ncbi:MAG: peptidylprolyl isomerase [Phycisphaerales bacterium]|nr:peptidylprolyl isomerase [Phycisphaerales bacterium]
MLDRQARRELDSRGIEITADDVSRERAYLSQSIARSAGVSQSQAIELVAQIRRSRGLGDVRFEKLAERNAILRRLVRDEVIVDDAGVQQAFENRHGPKHVVRLIVVSTSNEAGRALDRLRGGQGSGPEPFGEVAGEVSIDPTKFRGGYLDPLSLADPTYPAALRQTISRLQPGEVSQPVAIEEGYAIVKLEKIEPPSGVSIEQARPGLEQEVRLVRERVLMDRLAGRLLESTNVTVFDRSLEWSWRARRQSPGQAR